MEKTPEVLKAKFDTLARALGLDPDYLSDFLTEKAIKERIEELEAAEKAREEKRKQRKIKKACLLQPT